MRFKGSIYPSIKDVVGPAYYVVSCIPARHTPKLLEDCRDIGVKVLHLYAAGFSETGEPEGTVGII
jgi:acyl-CoA synthetase (NDP forming)